MAEMFSADKSMLARISHKILFSSRHEHAILQMLINDPKFCFNRLEEKLLEVTNSRRSEM